MMNGHLCSGPACGCQASDGRQSFLDGVFSGIVDAAAPEPVLSETALAADFARRPGKADAARRILLKGGTIISMDPAVGDFACGDLLIEGSKIAAVAPRIDADATVIDASEMIVIPGFCDPHIHAWQGNLPRIIPNHASTAEDEKKGTVDPATRTRNYRWVFHHTFGPAYRPEDTYIGTLMSLLSAINGGITTVCDNAHNSRTATHSDASIQALMDSGVRGIHAFGRPRFGSWDGQFPQDAYRLRSRYFSSDDQLTSLRLFMLGRDPEEELRQILEVRRDLDCWITFDSGIGIHPLVELYESGELDGRETINHGTFISREKMAAVVAHGATVNVCPRIETQFRFGDVPYQAWIEAGLKPAISNDDPATYAIDTFHEMQTLYAFQRAKAHRDALRGDGASLHYATLRDMLEAATIRGAQNCALDHKVGSLTPGKQADIVMINTDDIHLFPRHNAICTVVEGANVNSVDTVFIDGRIRKWRGKLVNVDFRRLRAAAEASRDYLFEKTQWPLPAIDLTD
ncbi:amidohydrolase family protein [Pseudochelatococcus sp. B33]